MKKQHLTLLFLFIISSFVHARQFTISGYVTVRNSGESLISSAIVDEFSGKSTISNSYGFYSFTLPEGNVQLKYSYIGFARHIVSLKLTKDTIINVALADNTELKELVVTGTHKGMDVKGSQMSVINIPISQIKTVPALMGENDVIKVLQLLPGVKAGTDGSAGMYVRGGGPDENLLLLDGIPVYNINHMFGFFSVLNADAVKDVTLYKGSFPARFGGRLSSVVDIRMNDGNNKKIHGNVTIGLITSKLSLEGPLFDHKTTFNISARRTYADLLIKPFIPQIVGKNPDGSNANFAYYFYDLNAKVCHTFSDKDRIYLSAYMGDDVLNTDMQQYTYNMTGISSESVRNKLNWSWGNVIGAFRWNHIINNKLFINTTASYTRYRFNLGMGIHDVMKYTKPDSTVTKNTNVTYKSGIVDATVKADFDWLPNPNHAIKFGTNFTLHAFQPDVTVLDDKTINDIYTINSDTTIGDPQLKSQEVSAYIEDNMNIGSIIQLNAGLHLSGFLVQNKLYSSLPQPRIGFRVLMSDNFSFKAGFARMSQYIHLLSNSNVSLPTDLWVPVTKRIPPMESGQYSAGFFYNLKTLINFSVEGYYKDMYNLIEYKDGASFMGSSTGWEDKVNIGKGWAYGIEFLAQKTVGKTTGWIGYTWSKSERQFNQLGQEINNGLPFPSKYDRRHDVSLVLAHKFNTRFDIAATWVYSTGNCGTLALQFYKGTPVDHSQESPYLFENELLIKGWTVQTIPYTSTRNNYRFEPYHRLDLSVNFHKQKKHGVCTWNISVYNAYNHFNPFITFVKSNYVFDPVSMQYTSKHSLNEVSILPLIPSVSYSYKF